MNVVWVTADLAVPARAGGQLRSLHLLRSLAAVTPVRLALLSPQADAAAVQAATGVAEVRQLGRWADPGRKRLSALRNGWPLDAAAVYDGEIAGWTRQHSGGGLLVVEHVAAAPYLQASARTVLSMHNDDARLLAETPSLLAGRSRWESRWNRRSTRRLQERAVRNADLLVCVSEDDRVGLGRADAVVVPNGTDLPTVVPELAPAGGVLFVGSMNYPPNRLAVTWWLEEVAPLLEPPVELTVVGRDADRILSPQPGLIIASDVPEVGPYLAAAAAVVVPLRHGGGSRLKLLEAMAWGRPVVTTSKGAEGFAVHDGRDVLVADSAQGFAAAVTRVLRDRDLAGSLVAAGHAFAAQHTWDTIGERFTEAVLGS